MGMKRCESGHYYDSGKNQACPLCNQAAVGSPKVKSEARAPHTSGSSPKAAEANGETVALMRKTHGIDPVVGWVVCVKGPNRGSDFRIKGEKNFVGRADGMDICLSGDETVSRENHAVLSFNPKNKSFKLHSGESRGLVYLNGEEVDSPKDLTKGDKIEVGQSTLMFVPLCGKDFDWEKV